MKETVFEVIRNNKGKIILIGGAIVAGLVILSKAFSNGGDETTMENDYEDGFDSESTEE